MVNRRERCGGCRCTRPEVAHCGLKPFRCAVGGLPDDQVAGNTHATSRPGCALQLASLGSCTFLHECSRR
jgi:hypothetical protein